MRNELSQYYRTLCTHSVLVLVFTLFSTSAVANTQLLMFEQEACHYCEKWMMEIGDRYHLSEEGEIAPLRRVRLEDEFPTDLPAVLSQISLTPTFVLMHEGLEIDRLTGYAGDEFFWVQLQQMLNKLPARPGAVTTMSARVILQ